MWFRTHTERERERDRELERDRLKEILQPKRGDTEEDRT